MKVYHWYRTCQLTKADTGCFLCQQPISFEDSFWLLKDKVWAETGLPQRHPSVFVVLHTECCEKMIGRKLEDADYVTTPARGLANARRHQQ